MRRLLLLLLGAVALVACTPSETGQYGPATWALDPAADIGPETTEFTAWVTELGCASGRSSADRIGGPDIQASDETVVVTFGVVPLGGAQECQGNPPTAVTVRLPEPLGDRRLLDGGREPPAEPPACANRESCQ
jgi:hypothetical protein